MPIYYALNMDFVSSFIVFINLHLGSIDLLQVEINKKIFPFKIKKLCIVPQLGNL